MPCCDVEYINERFRTVIWFISQWSIFYKLMFSFQKLDIDKNADIKFSAHIFSASGKPSKKKSRDILKCTMREMTRGACAFSPISL